MPVRATTLDPVSEIVVAMMKPSLFSPPLLGQAVTNGTVFAATPDTTVDAPGRSAGGEPWGYASHGFIDFDSDGDIDVSIGYFPISNIVPGADSAAAPSPAEGSKHAHAGKILRDHRGPW